MLSAVYRLLEYPVIGRPIRKMLWLSVRLTYGFHKIAAAAFNRHPYVRKLNGRSDFSYIPNQDKAVLRYYDGVKESISRLNYQPRISVLIPVYKVRTDFLVECLGSLAAQVYQNWEACIVDDASQDPRIDDVINKFAAKYPDRVRYSKNEKNSHICVTTNRALELATGDFVSLLDHDDRLLPNALAEVVRHVNLHPNADIFYSDECVIDQNGKVLGTYLKPGWSPLMHLSVNYTTHLSTYRRSLVNQIGGCRPGLEGSQDHDLMMRAVEASSGPVVHIPLVLYQWRSHELSTASGSDAKPYAQIAGVKAVTEACARRGRPASVIFEPKIHHYQVRFEIPEPAPLVSIVIPSRDGYPLIKACLDSIFEKSTYRNFEIVLVDHETKDPNCIDLFDSYSANHPAMFRRICYKGNFNFAALCNVGVQQSKGEFILLLNNDTEVQSPQWLEELVAVAQLPEVGAVGEKLLYPNGKIQHAGITGVGIQIAAHIGLQEPADSLAYFGYLQTTHETMAVTGACLMIKRAKYEQVGGLEEVFVPNGFGDVDLCLKLAKAGYSNVYTPYAVLVHKESVTRSVTFELFERSYMHRQWATELLSDPYRHISFNPFWSFNPEEQFAVQYPTSDRLQEMLKWI